MGTLGVLAVLPAESLIVQYADPVTELFVELTVAENAHVALLGAVAVMPAPDTTQVKVE